MVHFTKDSYVITIPELEPFDGYQRLQKSLADVMASLFANKDSVPDNDPIYYLADFMSNLSQIEQKQCFKINEFVQEL